jgi:zinc/manganese transport system substrate-binding protein
MGLMAGMLIAAPAAAEATPVIEAVASFSILADWVGEVGGDRVKVRPLVGANGDVHVYEPTPGDARRIAAADVIFVNGLGFEGWIDSLIRASGTRARVVVASQGVPAISEVFDHERVIDPHAWHSARNAVIYVRNIADGLCGADKAGCATYRDNAAQYIARLEALDQWIRAEIAAVPESKRRIITSHDSFAYFGREYGITVLAAQGISTEAEPTAGNIAKLIRQARREAAGALFIENVSDPRLIEQIARETGLKLGGRLYSDALATTDGATYIDMMRHNVMTLLSALKDDAP